MESCRARSSGAPTRATWARISIENFWNSRTALWKRFWILEIPRLFPTSSIRPRCSRLISGFGRSHSRRQDRACRFLLRPILLSGFGRLPCQCERAAGIIFSRKEIDLAPPRKVAGEKLSRKEVKQSGEPKENLEYTRSDGVRQRREA